MWVIGHYHCYTFAMLNYCAHWNCYVLYLLILLTEILPFAIFSTCEFLSHQWAHNIALFKYYVKCWNELYTLNCCTCTFLCWRIDMFHMFFMLRDIFSIYVLGWVFSFQFISFLSIMCSCVSAQLFHISSDCLCSEIFVQENVDTLVRLVQQ